MIPSLSLIGRYHLAGYVQTRHHLQARKQQKPAQPPAILVILGPWTLLSSCTRAQCNLPSIYRLESTPSQPLLLLLCPSRVRPPCLSARPIARHRVADFYTSDLPTCRPIHRTILSWLRHCLVACSWQSQSTDNQAGSRVLTTRPPASTLFQLLFYPFVRVLGESRGTKQR